MRRSPPPLRWAAPLLAAAAACAPSLGSPPWLVDSPRVLALVADAPELAPGASSTFRALVAGPQGELDLSSATWAICAEAPALTSSGPIAPACLAPLPPAGQGASPTLATSSDACSLFGPEGSSVSPRPHAPDATGGYYQPVQFSFAGALAFDEERLLCPLAQASFSVARQYQQTYPPNRNPILLGLDASVSGAPVSPGAVPPGAQVSLSLRWSADSNETFPVLDAASLTLVSQTETMRASWFATGGALAQSESAPDLSLTSSSNSWTAPSQPGPVFLWAVLRDSRGGAAWLSLRAVVEP